MQRRNERFVERLPLVLPRPVYGYALSLLLCMLAWLARVAAEGHGSALGNLLVFVGVLGEAAYVLLARRVADAQPLLKELSQEQEKAVVGDKKLLLMAICVLSQWTLEQVVTTYRLTEAEGIKYLAQLDRIGIIELRPLNRYRLKLAKTFRWRPHGPVMNYFREHALLDYFAGGFDGTGEGVLLVHGNISRSLAPAFMERMQRVAQDFAQQHLADQKLPDREREGYTLLLAMRSWEFEAFASMRR